jgi:hypothetical protein
MKAAAIDATDEDLQDAERQLWTVLKRDGLIGLRRSPRRI